jgi:hypothetical protein
MFNYIYFDSHNVGDPLLLTVKQGLFVPSTRERSDDNITCVDLKSSQAYLATPSPCRDGCPPWSSDSFSSFSSTYICTPQARYAHCRRGAALSDNPDERYKNVSIHY